MEATTFEQVKRILINQLGVDDEPVTLGARFIVDLGCDSLDRIELVIEAEEVFGIEIADRDFETFETVADAVAHIDTLIARKRPDEATDPAR